MIDRESGLVEIENRIVTAATALGIVTWKRSPLVPVDGQNMPFVFMLEGVDSIIDYSTRNPAGYPAKRQLEVTIEMVVEEPTDIKALYRAIRSVVLSDTNPSAEVAIYELRTEGPFGYGVPKLLGMRFVLSLIYFDKGN